MKQINPIQRHPKSNQYHLNTDQSPQVQITSTFKYDQSLNTHIEIPYSQAPVGPLTYSFTPGLKTWNKKFDFSKE